MEEGFNIRNCIIEGKMSESKIERAEFWITANRIVRETGQENFKKARIPVNTNWDLNTLQNCLDGYEDQQVLEYLKYRWPLNANETEEQEQIPVNQAGARKNEEEVRSYIKQELSNGSIIGPFFKNPFGKHARISPLDTRPKKNSEELRIILNLSHPFEGPSINNSIDKETYANGEAMVLRYPTTKDLANIIRNKSKNGRVKIFIRDLRKAYRQLWMSPESILLGFMYNDRFYFDVTLSMGSKSAAYCCQRTTNAITYVFSKFGFSDVNYLDDLGAAEEESRTGEAYDCLGYIMDTFGIGESKNKATPPSFTAVFLGILYDTINMTMSIKKERLEEILDLLEAWSNKRSTTLNEIRILLGKLNFVSSTVRSGRILVSQMINELKEYPKNGQRRLTKEFKKDIEWWLTYLEMFGGVAIIPYSGWSSPDRIFATNSCLEYCGVGQMENTSGNVFRTGS